MSCVLPQWRKRRYGDDEIDPGVSCTVIGFFVGSWAAIGFFVGGWSGVATEACLFVLRAIFLGDKLGESPKNEDEMPLNALNKADHS